MAFVSIKDGEFTSTIYGMVSRLIISYCRRFNNHLKIRDQRYVDVTRILQNELQRLPNVSVDYLGSYKSRFVESRRSLASRLCLLSDARLSDGG